MKRSLELLRSRQNTRLKDLRQRLLRPARDGLIAIEGEHLLQEAIHSNLRIDTVFLREDRADNAGWIPSTPEIYTVTADAFNHACTTESPQGIAALVQVPQWSFDAILHADKPRFVILAGLQDPGNVGTIIRSAEAFGANGILLTPGSVHPWNQKVLRASAGSSFRLPVVTLEKLSQLQQLHAAGVQLYACAADGEEAIPSSNLSGTFGFVIGNEGAGIPKEIVSLCTGTLHIPCSGPVESLNAAVAAAILLYEASRQRAAASIEDNV
jgi:TrmH family RNA methyltransferase